MACWLVGVAVLAAPAIGLDFADSFLGEGAVIQKDTDTTLWGTSSEGEVHVKIDGEAVATAVVDSLQVWSIRLPGQAAAFNRTLTISDSSESKNLTVSFGEVFVCAGQSNMDMAVNYEKFHADNGTAESAAAGRYTGGIWLKCMSGRPCDFRPAPTTFHWYSVTPDSLGTFSAICWYTGKAIYEYHNGAMPIGLIQGENGGTPIEKFITNESVATCGATHNKSTCGGQVDQFFYDKIVGKLGPYTMGALLWDQAEADMTSRCPHVDVYPCLEKQLVETWRAALGGRNVPFVAVQLPGYTDGVFEMRLAQELGLDGLDKAVVLPTYDLSCPNCPNGAVHNTDKQDVAARITQQLLHLLYGEVARDGPRATKVTAQEAADGYNVSVTFDGGLTPFTLGETRNCTTCCEMPGGDFDATSDGATWVAGTTASIAESVLHFQVKLPTLPTQVRYTAASIFPQCAVYNQGGLPAFPFQMKVQTAQPRNSIITV